jgi:transcriptional regulator with XRE-family HTH domain
MRENLKHIGENIRAARKSRGFTIAALSEMIGISESFLGLVERGESSISIDTLIGVCSALGVSADSIIMDDTEPSPLIAEKKDILLTLLNTASDDELDFYIDYVKLCRGRVSFNPSE